MTLFECKEKMQTITAQMAAARAWIAEKAADEACPMEDIRAKETELQELQGRYDIIKAEHDRLNTPPAAPVPGAKANEKAAFYRAAFEGKAYSGLGAVDPNNADLGYGDKLLPQNIASGLITEPVEDNPLRGISRITNITGYSEPKLGYTIQDADLADVADDDTANEIALTGDTVAYSRLEAAVTATIYESVLRGTDTDIEARVEGILRSAMAMREKHFAFLPAATAATDSVHAHMSFYNAPSGTSVIEEVTGDTMYEAIVNAYADLGEMFTPNAKIVMTKTAYYDMLMGLTNNAEALFGSKPAQILGVPVVFCDKATIPVIGDFSYYGINYDMGSVYGVDHNYKAGTYDFTLRAWGDQRIRLASAFRLAVVNP